MTDQYFIVANRMVRVIQSNSRASSSEQQKFIRSKQERLLNKVVRLCSVNIYFFVQDSITAAKIESEVEYVINDLSLIPKGALSDVKKKRTKFNAQRKAAGHRAFGSEYVHQFLNISDFNHIFSQFKRVVLSALGVIINDELPEEYEPAKYMAKASKLKAAIDLFRSRCQ